MPAPRGHGRRLVGGDGPQQQGEGGVDEAEPELTPDRAVALARGSGSGLAGIDERQLARVLAVTHNNAALAQRYVPTHRTGSVRLFVGTKGATEDEPRDREKGWAPHAGGALRVSRIGFRHEELLDPRPRSEVAAVLLADLADAER
ncbi:hypothetical protein RB200_28380 [Streptomyces sp. PmtG]